MTQRAPALAPALALILGLALAACEPAAPADPAVPAEPAPPAAPAAEAPLTEALLEGDGLTPAQPGGGTALKLAFGQPMDEVIAAMAARRGGAAPTMSHNAECGAGPLDFASWGDGVQLVFQDGRFAGWWLDEAAPTGFSTLSGLHIGSTLRELRAAHPDADIGEATIGPEFTAGGDIHGTLTGTNDAAEINNLYAGVSCIFR